MCLGSVGVRNMRGKCPKSERGLEGDPRCEVKVLCLTVIKYYRHFKKSLQGLQFLVCKRGDCKQKKFELLIALC